ncbi:MAG: hypothetical protein AAGJ10_02560 [Bacteroidota bacterium]
MTRFILVLILSIGLLTGCDSAVSARVDADRFFSLYGVLNPKADVQGVVVFPIEGTLRELPNEPLDATFTSRNVDTGQERVWRDSIRVTDEGAVHVFWSPFAVEYGERYTLDVTRPDGERSTVDLLVPPFAELERQPERLAFPTGQDVRVTAPVERLNRVQVEYTIWAKQPFEALRFPVIQEDFPPDPNFPRPEDEEPICENVGGDTGGGDPDDPRDSPGDLPDCNVLTIQKAFIVFNYTPDVTADGSGWTIPIDFASDFADIGRLLRRRGPVDSQYGTRLENIRLSMIAANAEWDDPTGNFDAEVLIQPGQLSNVDQGFGFVGAGYKLEEIWLPSEQLLQGLGVRIFTGIDDTD